MLKACARCGKVHPYNYKCGKRKYQQKSGEDVRLRNTHKWAVKSLEIRERANYLCEVCRDHNIYTYNNLEVHHIEKLREHPEKLLDNENLICLCMEHHHQADRGDLDPDYLRRLVHLREQTIGFPFIT